MESTPFQNRRRLATGMLVVTSLFWGLGFTWAKNLGEAINAAGGQGQGALLGPNVVLAARFLLAAAIWLALFPQARRGWTWASVRRGAILGGLMWAGVETQHLGLDRSSEATIAFLTNLTVVIVPLIVAIAQRAWPHPVLALSILLATVGIALLTGGGIGTMQSGDWLGVICALMFSLEIIAINVLMPRDSPFRLTAAMSLDPAPLLSPSLVTQFVLLTVAVTCVAFGLMNLYQPRVEPSRAAMIYLSEPIFAAAFAWVSEGAAMGRGAIVGAILILIANLIAEVRWPRRRRMIDASL